MTQVTAAGYLKYLARIITEVEVQNDCLGATHQHLVTIAKDTEAHATDAAHFATFVVALEKAEERIVNKVLFDSMVDDLFTPEEEEAIFGGDDE